MSTNTGRQLSAAIRAGQVESLRALLSQMDEGGNAAVTDDDIHTALVVAAEAGSVEACRLLWAKLSRHGKRIYFKATLDAYGCLHEAVHMGHLAVVCLFIEEFKWKINQIDQCGKTPLWYADNLEIARFLLKNGANVNLGGKYGPLGDAVYTNNTDMTRLFLVEYHANPNRRPADEEDFIQQHIPRNTDIAIQNGNIEILRLLIEHGAFVGHVVYSRNYTSLNVLLCNRQKSRENKVTICHILIQHAQEDRAAAKFLQDTFEFTIKQQTTDNIAECLRILIDAGFDPRTAMYCTIQAEHLSTCQLLVDEYGVDPFLQQEEEDGNDDSDNERTTAVSPFLASTRLTDTSLFEYFLGIWNEQFASTGGMNGDGDYPIHVVCCDPLVSLQAIHLLVNRHPDALAVVDGEQGLLPFHFAANWGANLDVIFYLLQHCPDALSHVGNNAAAAGSTSSELRDNDVKQDAPHLRTDDVVAVCEGPAKKKTKRST